MIYSVEGVPCRNACVDTEEGPADGTVGMSSVVKLVLGSA